MSSDLERIDRKLDELRNVIIGNGDHRNSIAARQLVMERNINDNTEQIAAIDKRLGKLEAGQVAQIKMLDKLHDYLKENPSLLWLIRYRTKQTIMWVIIVFVVLSLWWVSGWRQPILEFLGLPLF